MRLIDADDIRYDQLLNIGNKEHPLEWAVSQSSINSMPTIDAEPVRHGHWIERIKVYPDLLVTYNYQCSNCGYWDMHGSNVEVPYCWHCGAKMDEVTNETY